MMERIVLCLALAVANSGAAGRGAAEQEPKRFEFPSGSEGWFRDPGLWERYGWQLSPILALCAVQGLLIAVFLIQRARSARTEAARRSAEEQLLQSQAELRELTGKLLGAEEAERRRVARELHDDLGQELALLSVELDMLQQALPSDTNQLLGKIEKLSAHVKQLSSSVHDLSHQLHPMKLEQLGLAAALGGLCKELSAGHRRHIQFVAEGTIAALPPANALCLYRIAQEALQNVVKHSGAERAVVTLRGGGQHVCLEILDAGKGFDMQAVAEKAGIGLSGMRERVRLVKGSIEVLSRPGQGTCIRIEVPH